jgi:dihydroneopterin aldolase
VDNHEEMKIDDSYIYLDSLRFHAYHGVMPQERLAGHDYIVSLKIRYDFRKACLSDEVTDTLNYAAVYDCVKEEMAVPGNLLEHVAYRICDHLCKSFPSIISLTISLTKLAPPMGADCHGAGVELHLINNKTE